VFDTGGTVISGLYDDVFCKKLYESPKPLPVRPRIIDAGGHLGVSSLYFLTRYPSCRLTVIEANPWLAKLLKANLGGWTAQAEVIEAALSVERGTVDFHVKEEDLLAVTGAIDNRERPEFAMRTVKVPCVDARDLLTEPVDLMKLDVEGHEYALLRLPVFAPERVRNLVIEFHDLHRRMPEFLETMHILTVERGYRAAGADNVMLDAQSIARQEDCPIIKLF
jgi:FkbM family methyltransferase